MQPFHAVVKKGRLTLDEPSDLPEGQVVILLPLEELLELADGFGSIQIVPPQREWKEPKTMDAAALIAELEGI